MNTYNPHDYAATMRGLQAAADTLLAMAQAMKQIAVVIQNANLSA